LFSPGSPISSTNKTDHHDITEILLKVAFSTITLKIYINNSECNNRNYFFFPTLKLYGKLSHSKIGKLNDFKVFESTKIRDMDTC
jgi:hypothetical protein